MTQVENARVIIYVEGPSDKLAMQALLAPLLDQKLQMGVRIEFFDYPEGDRKKAVVIKVPVKAVNVLQNDPGAVVIAMPDLYPRNKGFPHETFQELADGINRNFEAALRTKGVADDQRLRDRFKVFCFKHDLEVLLLAAEESLQLQFGDQPLGVSWWKPVEDQNLDYPPRYVVEEIYRKHGQRYHGPVDAPLVLSGFSYQVIAERCPQCFKPFIEFLERPPPLLTSRANVSIIEL